jgi:hypothetical protein
MIRQDYTFILLLTLVISPCFAVEELITTAHDKDNNVIPYVLNYQNLSPKYVVILFPGGSGLLNPHLQDGALVYKFKGNFVIRTRKFIVDDEFVTVATNSSQVPERIQALLDDIKQRFPVAKIYLMSTSNGTFDTMHLADYLSERIAGEIHTSSLASVASFNAKQYKNRQLIVHHKNDECRATPFTAAESSHLTYGNDFIAMEDGQSKGDPCEPFAYHGYNGIEKETIEAIKVWIKKGG